MTIRMLSLVAAGFLSSLAVFACGDGADGKSASTPTAAVAAPTAARSPGASTIPAPKLPAGNVDAVRPVHGAKVAQVITRTPNADRPSGVCAQVNFKDLPENGQWFRMVIDGKEVTGTRDITWVLAPTAGNQVPEGGTMCFAPKDGLVAGIHQVALGVQNPRNPSEPTRQIVEWEFEVTP